MPVVLLTILITQLILYYLNPTPHLYYLCIIPILLLINWRPAQYAAIGLTIGLFSAFIHIKFFAPPQWPVANAQKPSLQQVKVIDIPEYYPEFMRVTLELQTPPKYKVRVRWYHKPPQMQVGEQWNLNLKLRPRRGRINPGAFDYEKSLYAAQISAEGYVVEDLRNQKLKPAPWWAWGRWRGAWYNRLQTALPDHPLAGFIPALSLGLRTGIQTEQWQRLQATGTAHLLAISGLHIGLLAGFFWVVCDWTVRRFPTLLQRRMSKHLAWIGALLIAFAYSACAGFALPTLRAVFTLAVSTWFRLRGWYQPWYWIFSLVVILILILEPFAILKPGFWLSCGAVLIILLLTQQRVARSNVVAQTTFMQMGLFVGMLPLSVIVLHQLSLTGLIANLFAVPWTSLLVTPLAIAATITVLFSKTLAFALAWIAVYALQLQWWLLGWFEWPRLNGIGLNILANPWAYSALLISGLLLCLPRGNAARYAAAIPLACILLFKNPAALPIGAVRLSVLDVGQGLAAVVQTTQHTLIFDTGPQSLAGDAGDFVLVPFLRYSGVRTVDALVLSHNDIDHRGGLETTLRLYPAQQLWASNLPDLRPHTGQLCQNGISWTWDGVTFKFLHPDVVPIKHGNNQSCVLQIINKNSKILLTGDIERDAEYALVNRLGSDLQSDYLVAAHHGSQSSSTKLFLDAVQPKSVIIPVGYMNRYRHPSKVVLARFKELGATIYNVAKIGALTVTISEQPGKVDIICYRSHSQPRWRVDKLHYCTDA